MSPQLGLGRVSNGPQLFTELPPPYSPYSPAYSSQLPPTSKLSTSPTQASDTNGRFYQIGPNLRIPQPQPPPQPRGFPAWPRNPYRPLSPQQDASNPNRHPPPTNHPDQAPPLLSHIPAQPPHSTTGHISISVGSNTGAVIHPGGTQYIQQVFDSVQLTFPPTDQPGPSEAVQEEGSLQNGNSGEQEGGQGG
ncbi:hypothetical protein MMC20_000066 [Loxospora ochrophaea]|nr:hypothetical protein [Loxospora ochrophaea]